MREREYDVIYEDKKVIKSKTITAANKAKALKMANELLSATTELLSLKVKRADMVIEIKRYGVEEILKEDEEI